MSAFYKVGKAVVPAGATASSMDVQAFYQDAEFYWLHSAIFPHPLADVIPNEVLGETWQEVWEEAPPEVRAVFLAKVRRDGERTRCAFGEVLETDELVAVWAPHRFAGETAGRIAL